MVSCYIIEKGRPARFRYVTIRGHALLVPIPAPRIIHHAAHGGHVLPNHHAQTWSREICQQSRTDLKFSFKDWRQKDCCNSISSVCLCRLVFALSRAQAVVRQLAGINDPIAKTAGSKLCHVWIPFSFVSFLGDDAEQVREAHDQHGNTIYLIPPVEQL